MAKKMTTVAELRSILESLPQDSEVLLCVSDSVTTDEVASAMENNEGFRIICLPKEK